MVCSKITLSIPPYDASSVHDTVLFRGSAQQSKIQAFNPTMLSITLKAQIGSVRQ